MTAFLYTPPTFRTHALRPFSPEDSAVASVVLAYVAQVRGVIAKLDESLRDCAGVIVFEPEAKWPELWRLMSATPRQALAEILGGADQLLAAIPAESADLRAWLEAVRIDARTLLDALERAEPEPVLLSRLR